MKKITLVFTSVILSFTLFSCASNSNQQSSADTYMTEEETLDQATEDEETLKENKSSSKTANQKAKRTANDKFKDIVSFTNKDDYIRYDESSLFTPEILGSNLKEKRATILLRVDNLNAGWGSPYAAAYYIVTFDEEARAKLKKAADAYFSDFDNKRLQRRGKHTDRSYGKISYRLDWGATSATTPNNGTGEGYLGYEFVKNSPYFVIYNYSFENKYYERAGDATTRESMTLRYYFTRAQLRQLLELISEENINAQINDSNYFTTPTEADEYTE